MVSFLEYLVFFKAVFCTEQLQMISRIDFDMVFIILIFDAKWGVSMGYNLCTIANFKMVSFFE